MAADQRPNPVVDVASSGPSRSGPQEGGIAALNEKALAVGIAAGKRAFHENYMLHGNFAVPIALRAGIEAALAYHASEPDAVAVEQAAAEIARLRAALRPFVERIPKTAYAFADEEIVAKAGIELKYFRQARAVLSPRAESLNPPLPAGSLMRPAVKP